MDRSIPVFNKLIISSTQKKNHQSHLRRLYSIRTGQSRAMTSLKKGQASNRYNDYNPKKQLMQEERRTEIEKQNIMLYNKMSKILNRTKNRSEISNCFSYKESKLKQLNKINEENKEIVKRLQNQKPTISNRRLYEEYMKKQKLLSFMGTYPYKQKFLSNNNGLHNNSISIIEGRRSLKTPSSKDSRMSKLQRKFQKMQDSLNKTHNLPSVKQAKQYASKECYQHDIGPTQSINLYRKNIIIENQVYQVLISRLHHQYEFKLYDENSFCYSLVIPQLQGNKILTDYDYDFGFISSCLKIVNNQLCLNIDRKRQNIERHRAQTPQQRVSFNQSKFKGFKLEQQVYQHNPQIVLQNQDNYQITQPQEN